MFNKKWIVGNWKMNGRQKSNRLLLDSLAKLPEAENVLVGLAVPCVYLSQAVDVCRGSSLIVGAQNVSQFDQDGAFTGEVSAQMLADIGASFTLVGHSERRQYFSESHQNIVQKLKSAVEAKLCPILCVGESLAEREDDQADSVVAAQLSVLDEVCLEQVIVAYEPVWAIGTGLVANLEQIAQMHQFIYGQLLLKKKNTASIRVLYGGSVSDKNAADILSVPNVDGALVGGASLKFDSFAFIVEASRDL